MSVEIAWKVDQSIGIGFVNLNCHIFMVLKTGLGTKSDLPLVPGFYMFLISFGRFRAFLPNRTGTWFPAKSVRLVGPVWFLKPCIYYIIVDSRRD